jgi:hypothetical protein
MSAKSASLKPAVPDDGDLMLSKTTSDRRPAASVNVPQQLSSLGRMNTLAPWGGQLAWALLREPLPRRWAHVQGVAARARGLAPVLGVDADLIEAAAWLHDIGYAPGLAATGLHQLDGARTCATPSTPTPCCAGWSPTTPTPSSKPANADSPTS